MKKRLLSVVMTLVMLCCVLPVGAIGNEEVITVYFSLSRYGDIVESSDGEPMAYVPVLLSGKENYNLDDVLKKAHQIYYSDREAGYASSEGEFGFAVDMLWGDTSKKFGYQVNAGTETVNGLTHPVSDGDYIDACIYKNFWPDTEGYARFNTQREELLEGQEISLLLTYSNGYDEEWNVIYSPCEEATILINGEETELLTDEDGKVNISFPEAGSYIVSAKKTKILKEETVPAITAPVCLVKVIEPELKLIHNIAGMYAGSDFAQAGGNLPWILADMAIYEELFPESENCLSEEKREEALELMVEFAKEAEIPGDLAKAILGFRALGFDARRIFTASYEHIDLVEKLSYLVESGDEAVLNIYTLPYVIIALSNTEPEKAEMLITKALESKDAWQSLQDGTDALTPMILALMPYAEGKEEVRTAMEESVEILKREQREDGLIDGFPGYESASTGLAICAMSAAGVDSAEVICGGKSLIDGLISVANEEFNGFPNAFATEQGFRGLLAWLLMGEEKRMYDFSDYSLEEANLSVIEYCPVIFDVSPSRAKISIEGEGKTSERIFDLSEGEYTYEVTASEYKKMEGSFTISAEDAENHKPLKIKISLKRKPQGGSGGGGFISTEPEKEEVTEPVKTPETETAVEQEKNPEPEKAPETEKTVNILNIFTDVKPEAWYIPAVEYVYEKGLFGGTDRGFEPEGTMTRAMIVTVLYRLDKPETKAEDISFGDVEKNAWYADGVAWATDKGVVMGIAENEFAPNSEITREQIAVTLYRYAKLLGIEVETTGEISFKDKDSVSEYAKEAVSYAVYAGILGGNDNNMLCPGEKATRAEVATMLMRFAEVVNK